MNQRAFLHEKSDRNRFRLRLGRAALAAEEPPKTPMSQRYHFVLRLLALACAMSALAGCPAVYPELGTRMRKALTEVALDPPPPEDMAWLKFKSARVPERTRGHVDFPAGAGRYLQRSSGYRCTLVNGQVFVEDGTPQGVHAGVTLRA